MIKSLLALLVLTAGLLAGPALGLAQGQRLDDPVSSSPDDPDDLLREIQEQDDELQAVFPVSPLGGLRDRVVRAKQSIYQATGFELGLALTTLGQGLSDALPGEARSGTATIADFVVKKTLVNKGSPTQGAIYYELEGKWDYGTVGPQELGFVSLASAGGTADSFSATVPAFLSKNLYWQQGSQEAGWAYRAGKITPDANLLTSQHLSSRTTFLPNAGESIRADAFPDAGLGLTGVLYPNDRVAVNGLISDANADRYWGDLGAGEYYKAVELAVKIAPRTQSAGYSKFDLWHNDGTKDGERANDSTGREGWGFAMKLEQELSADGQAIGIFRYGRSFDQAAIYKEQAGLSLLFYEPFDAIRLENDLLGVAVNWVNSSAPETRDEYNFEVFYRFPMFPAVQGTLSYQSVIHPAFTTAIDHASAFSFRLRSTY